jgi:pSer/pThr/pTyr-binding forkhead associated (FHA) protein
LIKDLGCGYGVFMKMESPKELTNEILFNIGEAYMVINLLAEGGDEDSNPHNEDGITAPRIKIKIFDKSLQGESQIFKNEGRPITIGRSDSNDVKINDKLLSKTQCHIICDEDNRWVLHDGWNNRKSTNGTWYYIKEDTEVTDGMALKANLTIFEVALTS